MIPAELMVRMPTMKEAMNVLPKLKTGVMTNDECAKCATDMGDKVCQMPATGSKHADDDNVDRTNDMGVRVCQIPATGTKHTVE